MVLSPPSTPLSPSSSPRRHRHNHNHDHDHDHDHDRDHHPHPQYFTCTFCWHVAQGPPHALGRSSRLTCASCFRGLIDLLGWCFWHRACYGCILCGSRAVVSAPAVGDLFRDDDDDDDYDDDDKEMAGAVGLGQKRTRRGKEIADVPLCAYCVVGCEAHRSAGGGSGGGGESVVQKALRRIDRVDGGVTRKRWEKRDGAVSLRATGAVKRVPVGTSKGVAVPDPPSQRPPYAFEQVRKAANRLAGGDGALSGSGDSGDSAGDCVVPLDSTIYVSIFDPLGEPAFKPSRTKPIPLWMQMLPGNRGTSRDPKPRPHSILDDYLGRPASAESVNPAAEVVQQHIVCPTSPPVQDSRQRPHVHWRDPPGAPASSAGSEVGSLPDIGSPATFKGHSFVTYEPLKRPSSRITRAIPEPPSPTTSVSVPDRSPTLAPRSKTPYVYRQPSPLAGTTTAAAATVEAGTPLGDDDPGQHQQQQERRPTSPLTDQVVAHLQRYLLLRNNTPPTQSREYLNLYGPVGAAAGASASTAVRGRLGSRAVGRGEQVQDMLAAGAAGSPSPISNSVSPPSLAVNHDTPPGPFSSSLGTVVTSTGDVRDAGSTRKRSSLPFELKRFFVGRGGGAGGRE
ncbi:hypothetical protein F4778DRAFT_792345 [Xylariomycetidae sp. FL2044]|nr:hypothetical protein F4778DRAFT_792345 [Xylariomycetidae sp. FL2044]